MRNLALGAAALPYVFTTPPTVTTDLVGFMLNFNMNTDAPKIGPPPGIYTTPAMQFMAASGGSNPGLANAQGFVRLFPVASMNHCGGGPATDQFDALTSIVNWVEQGQAPASIAASANAASGFAGRTWPLCPYPQVARYRGTGSVNDAASFICQ